MFVVLFAVIGATFLIISRAATPTFSIEPENGTRTGSISVIPAIGTDSTLSGGKAITFGSAVVPPTGCNPTSPPDGSAPSNPTPCRYGQSNGPSGTWNFNWQDEFSGTALDFTKWRPNYLGGSDSDITKASNSSMQNCEDPAQTKVNGGTLKLTLVQRSCKANNGTTYPYASGYASTHADIVITSSFYIETKMYMPPANSTTGCANWPGIWTNGVANGVSWPTFLESDVMECLGGEAKANVHAGPGANQDDWKKTIGGIGQNSGWHVFAASLVKSAKSGCPSQAPDSAILTYYYDGVQIGSPYETCYKNTGQFIMLQNDIQSGSLKNTLPSTVEFDYVRVWAR